MPLLHPGPKRRALSILPQCSTSQGKDPLSTSPRCPGLSCDVTAEDGDWPQLDGDGAVTGSGSSAWLVFRRGCPGIGKENQDSS